MKNNRMIADFNKAFGDIVRKRPESASTASRQYNGSRFREFFARIGHEFRFAIDSIVGNLRLTL